MSSSESFKREIKTAIDELRETAERKNEEVENLKTTLPETEEKLDAIQDRLDEFEKKANRRNLGHEADEESGMTEEEKTFLTWLQNRSVDPESYRKHLVETDLETKDLSVGSGAGNQSDALAPVEFVEELITDVVEISPVRQAARTLQTERKQVEIPKLQGRPSAAFVSEGGSRTDDTGTDFGSDNADMLVIDLHEFYVELPITRQMIEDSVFDVEAEVRDLVSTEMQRLQGNKFLQGSGSGEPQGLVTDSSFNTIVTGDTTTDAITSIVADEIRTHPLELKAEYRQNGQWGLTREALRHVRTLEDSSGDYLFEQSLDAETPSTIDGYPYVEMQDLVTTAAAGQGDIPVVFGDMQRAYYIADRLQMEVIRDPYSLKSSGKIEYHFRGRVGGHPANYEAVKGIEIG